MRSLLQTVYGPSAAVMRDWNSYRWITILGGFVAFALACASGANDVAVSFGTSIGSGALSMSQAVMVASVMEFVGATVMGDRDLDSMPFYLILKERPPDAGLFMWGLFIAMLAATVWLAFATYLELPVSSTLAIIGGVIGMAFTAGGIKSIYWNNDGQKSALNVGGMLEIVLSWFLAPVIAGVASFSLFMFTKLVLLRSEHAETRTLQFIPFYYGVTVMVLIFFVIYKGTCRTDLHDWPTGRSALVAGLSGIVATILAFVIIVPIVRKQFSSTRRDVTVSEEPEPVTVTITTDGEKNHKSGDEQNGQQELEPTPEELIKQFNQLRALETVYEGEEEGSDDPSPDVSVKCSPVCGPAKLSFAQLLARTPNRHRTFKRIRPPKRLTPKQKMLKLLQRLKCSTVSRKIDYDRPDVVRHALAEKFDDKVEELFCFLQVLTACVLSFAHGANDIPAVMGPYAAITQIFDDRTKLPTGKIDIWILALAGFGVSVGFAVWGWKLSRCLGGRLTFLTPSRGYVAQICAVATILFASRARFPVSTTHVVVGAIAGVGSADNIKNVNWKLLVGFVVAWIATILCTCGIAAALYSFTVFSPSYSVG